jgi:hypothetical protein
MSKRLLASGAAAAAALSICLLVASDASASTPILWAAGGDETVDFLGSGFTPNGIVILEVRLNGTALCTWDVIASSDGVVGKEESTASCACGGEFETWAADFSTSQSVYGTNVTIGCI